MFDKVVYINLDHRTDRKAQIENELTSIGINDYERFPGIKHEYPPAGCTASHLNVLKMARDKGYKNILIFEDDFEFIVPKDEFWKQIEAIKDIEYDVIMLSYNLNTSEPFNDTLLKVLDAQTASGYLVNSTFYTTLIDNLEAALPKLIETHEHWSYINDQCWKTIQPQNKWYAFKMRLGKQRQSHSDLMGRPVNYKLGGNRKNHKKYKGKKSNYRSSKMKSRLRSTRKANPQKDLALGT